MIEQVPAHIPKRKDNTTQRQVLIQIHTDYAGNHRQLLDK